MDVRTRGLRTSGLRIGDFRTRGFRTRGFTLVEVLIALAIIAIALASVIKSSGDSAGNMVYLRDKTFAHWVAMNRMAEVLAADSLPSKGSSEGDEEMGGVEWYWTTKVEETPNKYIRRIDVTVRTRKSDDGSSVAVLTGFAEKLP